MCHEDSCVNSGIVFSESSKNKNVIYENSKCGVFKIAVENEDCASELSSGEYITVKASGKPEEIYTEIDTQSNTEPQYITVLGDPSVTIFESLESSHNQQMYNLTSKKNNNYCNLVVNCKIFVFVAFLLTLVFSYFVLRIVCYT